MKDSPQKIAVQDLLQEYVVRFNKFRSGGLSVNAVKDMLDDDAIQMAIQSILLPIRSAKPMVEGDDRIAEYYQETLDEWWSILVEYAVSAMAYGYNWQEVMFIRDGLYKIKGFRDADISMIEILRDDEGNTVGFKNSIENIEVPIYKSLWLTWQATYKNPYGVSFLKPAFKSWFNKSIMMSNMVQYFQRKGEPPFIVKYPPSPEIDQTTGESNRKDVNRDTAIDIIENLHSKKGIAMPSYESNGIEEVPSWSFEEVSVNFQGESFLNPIKVIDNQIYRALLLPDTQGSSNTGSGSYALAKSQQDLRASFLDGIAQHFIDELTAEGVGLLWWLGKVNFGKFEMPAITVPSFDKSSQDFRQDLIKSVINSPQYQIDLDVNKLLEAFELPLIEFDGERQVNTPEEPATIENMQLQASQRARATNRDKLLDELYKLNRGGLIATYRPVLDWLERNSGKLYSQYKNNPASSKLKLPSELVHSIEQSFDTMELVGYLSGRKTVIDRAVRVSESKNLQCPFSNLDRIELQEMDLIGEWWKYPPEEVIEIFRSRVPMTSGQYEALASYTKEQAFSLALANSEHISNVFQKSLVRSIESGESLQEWRNRVKSETIPSLGLTEQNDFYLNNVYRTNMASAFSAGNYSAFADPFVKSIFPALQYVVVGDDRTRPSHMAQDGTIYPVDHPYWDEWYPPNDYQCRCYVIELMAEEYIKDVAPKQRYKPEFSGHVGKQWLRRIA